MRDVYCCVQIAVFCSTVNCGTVCLNLNFNVAYKKEELQSFVLLAATILHNAVVQLSVLLAAVILHSAVVQLSVLLAATLLYTAVVQLSVLLAAALLYTAVV